MEQLRRELRGSRQSATRSVNLRSAIDVLNLLVYVRPRMSVRPDVVEFID